MQAAHYAQALFQASRAQGADAVVLFENLRGVLERRGHLALLPQIGRALARAEAISARHTGLRVRIASANEKSVALREAKVIALERKIPEDSIFIEEDPDLLKGFVIEGVGFRLDRSARAALVSLYQQLTA